nr:type II secretion system protein N [Polymorphobacter sp.]
MRVFIAMLMLAGVALLPLRVVLAGAGLDAAGVSARAVTGSVWWGRMDAAAVRGARLGDVRVRLAPLALAAGTMRFEIAGATVRGAVLRSRDGGGIAGVTGQLGAMALGGLPVAGVALESVDIGFARGVCQVATGQLRLVPGGLMGGFGALAGAPRCDGAAVVVPLVSASGDARLELRIAADGGYRAVLAVKGVDEAARDGLLAAGFQPTPQGLVMRSEGRL